MITIVNKHLCNIQDNLYSEDNVLGAMLCYVNKFFTMFK